MRTFSRAYGTAAVAALLAMAGCLRKEVTHTIYLSPSGVTWSAIEKDVRSDDSDPAVRLLEEQDYLLGARASRHEVARALGDLGAARMRTTLLRDERPFTVVTDGHFTDLGALALAALRRLHLRGDAAVDGNGCEKTFRAWAEIDDDAGPGAVDAESIGALLDGGADYRLVLTEGRFVRAEGFTITDESTIAVPGSSVPADGVLRVSLTWSEGWCGAAQPAHVAHVDHR
jgi:hypothetical protein